MYVYAINRICMGLDKMILLVIHDMHLRGRDIYRNEAYMGQKKHKLVTPKKSMRNWA